MSRWGETRPRGVQVQRQCGHHTAQSACNLSNGWFWTVHEPPALFKSTLYPGSSNVHAPQSSRPGELPKIGEAASDTDQISPNLQYLPDLEALPFEKLTCFGGQKRSEAFVLRPRSQQQSKCSHLNKEGMMPSKHRRLADLIACDGR